MQYVDGAAFDLHYETFAPESEPNEDGLSYKTVKDTLIKHFDQQENPQKLILSAVLVSLVPLNLSTSLRAIHGMLRRAEFNDSAKFGLLRQAVIEFTDLARFAMYPGDEAYEGLK